jgi:predicted metal-dependent enzyme (double-stranded beta helix superfamily)
MSNNLDIQTHDFNAGLTKEEIANYIYTEVAEIWREEKLGDKIQVKISTGQALISAERAAFIASEARNINAIRNKLTNILRDLESIEPNYVEKLVEDIESSSSDSEPQVRKFLIALDTQERFFIDLFYFEPRAGTKKHSHNAHCVSQQVLGNLREVVYRPTSENSEEVSYVRKTKGWSTIVSPHGDVDDTHAILNDENSPAATLHIYAQRVLQEDGVVKINRSNQQHGPTAVNKYLSDYPNFTLALRPQKFAGHEFNNQPKKTTIGDTMTILNNPDLQEALRLGSTSILPKNRRRLLPSDPKILDAKIANIIADSHKGGHVAKYNSEIQFTENGLVIS